MHRRQPRFTYLKSSTNAIDEILPAVLLGIVQSDAFHFRSHGTDNVLHFVIWEQIRNFSGR